MNIWVKILSVFAFYCLITPTSVFARSGCCSHHGGVCGCRCCDGSALSAKCAPYYPSCNSAPVVQKVYPTATIKPKPIIPTKIPTVKPTATRVPVIPNPTVTLMESPKPTSNTTVVTPTPPHPSNSPQVMGTSDTNQESKTASGDGSTVGGILLAGMGYGGYRLIKKLKKEK